MKYTKTCECCGTKLTAYTLPFNEGLVSAFVRFAEQYMKEGRPLKKPEMGLTNSQYTNFHNLRHFGIIWQSEKREGWILTKLGERFYYGEEAILSPAGFMAGETLEPDHDAWKTHASPRKSVYINSILPSHYKQRKEYQQEKGGKYPTLFD